MRLEIASYKAVKYACLNFHYSKSVPVNTFGYSVFNDKNEWCGVVLYGTGASPQIGVQFGLKQGQVIEFVRMALNGKQEIPVSKIMAISLKLFKKMNPLVKICVSYADQEQGHIGTIYQASNWYYCGEVKSPPIIEGKHNKSLGGSIGAARKILKREPKVHYPKPKHKYIYPLDKSVIAMCKELSKPYPKKLSGVVESNANSQLDVKCVTTTLTPLVTDTKIIEK
jgi:hypothetical protein